MTSDRMLPYGIILYVTWQVYAETRIFHKKFRRPSETWYPEPCSGVWELANGEAIFASPGQVLAYLIVVTSLSGALGPTRGRLV